METDKSQYSHAGKKVTAYTTKFKLAAVQFAEECKAITKQQRSLTLTGRE